MALTLEAVVRFGKAVTTLDSFPLFIGYLLMVFLAGVWQRFTKPLSLRPVLVVYNFFCSGLSVYTFFGFIYGLYNTEYVYQRAQVPLINQMFYWYHLTKKIELLDTVFMVLRHKRRQISFLHVYHHSSMLVLSDFTHTLSPYPSIAPIFLLNSAVHVCLYTYYALTALDPSRTPSWKPRLTEIQIAQFYVDVVYAFYGYLYHGFCVYGFIYGAVMIYLFSSFYYHAYIKAKKPVKKQVQDNNNFVSNGIQKVPRGKIE